MADVKLKFTADTADADNGISNLRKSLNGLKNAGISFGTAMKTAMTAAATGIGALVVGLGALGAGLTKGLKTIIDFSGEIKDVADATGASVKELVILQEQFRAAGVDAGLLQKILIGLSNKLEDPSPGLKNALEDIGLSIEDFESLSIIERFEKIREGLGNITSETRRAALAVEFFGKQGADLSRLFGDEGSRESAIEFLGELPVSMQKVASTLEAAGDVIDGLFVKVRQFFAGFATQVLEPITELVDTIKTIDLTSYGVELGSIVRTLIELIKNINSNSLFIEHENGDKEELTAFEVLKRTLLGTLLSIIDPFVRALSFGIFQAFQLAFNAIINSDTFNALLKKLGYTRVYSAEEEDPRTPEQKAIDAMRGVNLGKLFSNKVFIPPIADQSWDEFNNNLTESGHFLGQIGVQAQELLTPFRTLQGILKDGSEGRFSKEEAERNRAEEERIAKQKQRKEELKPINEFFSELRMWTSEIPQTATLETIYGKEPETVKQRLDNVLGSLAKIGGAKAELTGAGVVNFQTESLKYQRETAANTRRISNTAAAFN